MAYATVADVEAYIEGWVTDDAAALNRLIARAEDDVDRLLGPRVPNPGPLLSPAPDGRAYDPSVLPTKQANALRDATCAQVEYRAEMGEEFFRRPRYDQVAGPDFTTTGKAGWYAPKAVRTLAGSGLMRVGVPG